MKTESINTEIHKKSDKATKECSEEWPLVLSVHSITGFY